MSDERSYTPQEQYSPRPLSDERVHNHQSWMRTHRERHPFGLLTYLLYFVLIATQAVVFLHWSVTDSWYHAYHFVWQAFTEHKYMFFTNFIIVVAIYLVIVALINRFWMASEFFILAIGVYSIANRLKLMMRAETITPADFNFVSGGNAGNILEWIPSGTLEIFVGAALFTILSCAATMILSHWDTRRRVIDISPFFVRLLIRIIAAGLSAYFLASFTLNLATLGSWSNRLAVYWGDSPKLWNSRIDAEANGAAVSFARLVNPKVMDEPQGYSQKAMEEIVRKYSSAAEQINSSRSRNLTDNTVVFVLSESLSDPARVPGIKLNKDVIPQIRDLKSRTTSGLMLSSGYGGGTANMEYMSLTGLSMANFAPSLTSPYQQLVPNATWTPTFNQFWGVQNSEGFHPYQSSMYSRKSNYKKFGFQHFWALNPPDIIQPQDKIDSSPYASDESSYTAVLNAIRNHKNGQPQFIQLSTMQNHFSYKNWYSDNDIKVSSTTAKPLDEKQAAEIKTYARGLQYTDEATMKFLKNLDALDRPVTVIFYGDHLPGIYSTAAADDENSLALHETDYFIWSNKATGVDNATQAKEATNSAYTSPNFFMAQAAQHMSAKVSPYIAFLTQLHGKVSAMEPPVVNKVQSWTRIPQGQALFQDGKGNLINLEEADTDTRQLLSDYKMIQYDITAGKNYLKNTAFMTIPSAKYNTNNEK